MHKQKKYRAITPGVAWLLAELQLDSPYGREALKNMQPAGSANLPEQESNLDELAAIVTAANSDPDFLHRAGSIFKCLRYIGGSLDNLEAGLTPDETELLEIKGFAILLESLKKWYDSANLQLPSINFADLSEVVTILNPDSMIVSSFYVHEAYSERLKELRTAKRALEQQILQSGDQAAKDSLRQKRLLIVEQEKDEECRVRCELGKKLRVWVADLRQNGHMAGLFELLLAKAKIAVVHHCVRPEIFLPTAKEPMLAINMRNPEVEESLSRQGKQFTPVSIEVICGTTLLTGANMGGKTIALMTLAMNAELATLGFFVFAERFSTPLFDFIYLIAGDNQSSISGLSSFGAEIIRLSELTTLTRKGTGLAVCDEFARSTNPSEGSRFVQALGEYLHQSGSYGIIATHYDGIKITGAGCYQVIGLKNQASAIPGAGQAALLDNLCANMDYRLVKISNDYQVPKEALHIASILGVDAEFLGILKRLYPEDKNC